MRALLEWFNFERVTHHREALSLLLRLASGSPLCADTLCRVGGVEFLRQARSDLPTQIQPLADALLETLLQVPPQTLLPDYMPEAPAAATRTSSRVVSAAPSVAELIGDTDTLAACLRQHEEACEAILLIPSDERYLSELIVRLKLNDPTAVLRALTEFTDRVIHDFPPELFLQRNGVVSAIISVVHNTEAETQADLAVQALAAVCAWISRLQESMSVYLDLSMVCQVYERVEAPPTDAWLYPAAGSSSGVDGVSLFPAQATARICHQLFNHCLPLFRAHQSELAHAAAHLCEEVVPVYAFALSMMPTRVAQHQELPLCGELCDTLASLVAEAGTWHEAPRWIGLMLRLLGVWPAAWTDHQLVPQSCVQILEWLCLARTVADTHPQWSEMAHELLGRLGESGEQVVDRAELMRRVHRSRAAGALFSDTPSIFLASEEHSIDDTLLGLMYEDPGSDHATALVETIIGYAFAHLEDPQQQTDGFVRIVVTLLAWPTDVHVREIAHHALEVMADPATHESQPSPSRLPPSTVRLLIGHPDTLYQLCAYSLNDPDSVVVRTHAQTILLGCVSHGIFGAVELQRLGHLVPWLQLHLTTEQSDVAVVLSAVESVMPLTEQAVAHSRLLFSDKQWVRHRSASTLRELLNHLRADVSGFRVEVEENTPPLGAVWELDPVGVNPGRDKGLRSRIVPESRSGAASGFARAVETVENLLAVMGSPVEPHIQGAAAQQLVRLLDHAYTTNPAQHAQIVHALGSDSRTVSQSLEALEYFPCPLAAAHLAVVRHVAGADAKLRARLASSSVGLTVILSYLWVESPVVRAAAAAVMALVAFDEHLVLAHALRSTGSMWDAENRLYGASPCHDLRIPCVMSEHYAFPEGVISASSYELAWSMQALTGESQVPSEDLRCAVHQRGPYGGLNRGTWDASVCVGMLVARIQGAPDHAAFQSALWALQSRLEWDEEVRTEWGRCCARDSDWWSSVFGRFFSSPQLPLEADQRALAGVLEVLRCTLDCMDPDQCGLVLGQMASGVVEVLVPLWDATTTTRGPQVAGILVAASLKFTHDLLETLGTASCRVGGPILRYLVNGHAGAVARTLVHAFVICGTQRAEHRQMAVRVMVALSAGPHWVLAQELRETGGLREDAVRACEVAEWVGLVLDQVKDLRKEVLEDRRRSFAQRGLWQGCASAGLHMATAVIEWAGGDESLGEGEPAIELLQSHMERHMDTIYELCRDRSVSVMVTGLRLFAQVLRTPWGRALTAGSATAVGSPSHEGGGDGRLNQLVEWLLRLLYNLELCYLARAAVLQCLCALVGSPTQGESPAGGEIDGTDEREDTVTWAQRGKIVMELLVDGGFFERLSVFINDPIAPPFFLEPLLGLLGDLCAASSDACGRIERMLLGVSGLWDGALALMDGRTYVGRYARLVEAIGLGDQFDRMLVRWLTTHLGAIHEVRVSVVTLVHRLAARNGDLCVYLVSSTPLIEALVRVLGAPLATPCEDAEGAASAFFRSHAAPGSDVVEAGRRALGGVHGDPQGATGVAEMQLRESTLSLLSFICASHQEETKADACAIAIWEQYGSEVARVLAWHLGPDRPMGVRLAGCRWAAGLLYGEDASTCAAQVLTVARVEGLVRGLDDLWTTLCGSTTLIQAPPYDAGSPRSVCAAALQSVLLCSEAGGRAAAECGLVRSLCSRTQQLMGLLSRVAPVQSDTGVPMLVDGRSVTRTKHALLVRDLRETLMVMSASVLLSDTAAAGALSCGLVRLLVKIWDRAVWYTNGAGDTGADGELLSAWLAVVANLVANSMIGKQAAASVEEVGEGQSTLVDRLLEAAVLSRGHPGQPYLSGKQWARAIGILGSVSACTEARTILVRSAFLEECGRIIRRGLEDRGAPHKVACVLRALHLVSFSGEGRSRIVRTKDLLLLLVELSVPLVDWGLRHVAEDPVAAAWVRVREWAIRVMRNLCFLRENKSFMMSKLVLSERREQSPVNVLLQSISCAIHQDEEALMRVAEGEPEDAEETGMMQGHKEGFLRRLIIWKHAVEGVWALLYNSQKVKVHLKKTRAVEILQTLEGYLWRHYRFEMSPEEGRRSDGMPTLGLARGADWYVALGEGENRRGFGDRDRQSLREVFESVGLVLYHLT